MFVKTDYISTETIQSTEFKDNEMKSFLPMHENLISLVRVSVFRTDVRHREVEKFNE